MTSSSPGDWRSSFGYGPGQQAGSLSEYIWSQGINIYSLIHDGLITSACSEQLLRGIADYIAQHGWDIRLAEKPLHWLQDAPIPELAPLY